MCPKQRAERGLTQGKMNGASEPPREASKLELMDCSFGSNKEKLLACPTVQITFADWEFQAMIDTDYTQTLVKATLVPANMEQPMSLT